MKLEEAYKILNIPQSSTPEEAKKKYRELAKQYHPDINKAPNADEEFKKINEAFQCVQSGKGSDPEDRIPNPFHGNPFEGFVNPFSSRQRYYPQNIQINTTISFKESVIGCKKDISFQRKTKCKDCNGQGKQKLNNGCDKCKGQGTFTQQQGNMIFTQTCNKCMGRINIKNCDSCSSNGFLNSDVSVQVNIPGGVINNNILRLGNMGNFIGSNMFGQDEYTDTHLLINVTPSNTLSLIDNDVVSSLQISLLDAVQGCEKSIETIDGPKNITIPQNSKNKEEIVVPNMGVNYQGSQRVILNVSYPDNLLNLLQKD